MTLREDKGSLYEGGVLVPGVLEWPAKIKKPASTTSVSVTSDFLPTLAELTGMPLPQRPIDGISLVPVIQNPQKEREQPLCFWKFNINKVFGDSVQNYINHELQVGTTPLAKKMGDIYTRNFNNYVYENISQSDFGGERTILSGKYKLILDSESPKANGIELYDVLNDRTETKNISSEHPDKVKEMSEELRKWQQSVLNSLTGADYE
jgi:arylsulfatase A-like enzyme